jgi:hypothetical protein
VVGDSDEERVWACINLCRPPGQACSLRDVDVGYSVIVMVWVQFPLVIFLEPESGYPAAEMVSTSPPCCLNVTVPQRRPADRLL